jgi:hypothetical protein
MSMTLGNMKGAKAALINRQQMIGLCIDTQEGQRQPRYWDPHISSHRPHNAIPSVPRASSGLCKNPRETRASLAISCVFHMRHM